MINGKEKSDDLGDEEEEAEEEQREDDEDEEFGHTRVVLNKF